MTNKRMQLLEKLSTLIERNQRIKREEFELNQEIAQFIETELEIKGHATLLDISKRLLEVTADAPRIIQP